MRSPKQITGANTDGSRLFAIRIHSVARIAQVPSFGGGITRMSHEKAFVRAFILSDKQSRYLWLLASRKRRSKFLDRLNHHLDYDPAFAVRVPTHQQTPDGIEFLLRRKGAANSCHVISSSRKWDGRDLPLREALEDVLGFSIGTVLCCNPGRLAYYEAEDMGHRFIFSR